MVGGAEIVLHQMAKRLQDRGWEVEILTTTAMNHHTWESELPRACRSPTDGLLVRRFPAIFQQTEERQRLEGAIMAGHPVSIADQQRWINSGMRSPELFHHLLDHGDDYRALIFTPYPTWLAFACSQLLPERTVLWTCLHDEPYAYLELFQPMFTGVAGLLLQTEPEHELAHRVAAARAARGGRLRGRDPAELRPGRVSQAVRHRGAVPALRRPARGCQGLGDAARPAGQGDRRAATCRSPWSRWEPATSTRRSGSRTR